MKINELCRKAHKMARDKGFWDEPREFGTMIALIHGELSEALEEHRCGRLEKLGEELADVAIRLGDLCGGLKINLEDEIAKKMVKNSGRARLHGKNY